MAEILYKYDGGSAVSCETDAHIRWLTIDDYTVFAEHLKLCGQQELPQAIWNKIYEGGDSYAGLFVDDKMVARADVEKYSETAWEIGDVRTANAYRNRGYACRVCKFVLKYICDNDKMPTMRTEADNHKMQGIIKRLGFVEM